MPNLPQQCQFSPLPVHLSTPQGLVVVVVSVVVVVDDVVVMVVVEVVVEVVVIVVVVVPVYLEYQYAPCYLSTHLICFALYSVKQRCKLTYPHNPLPRQRCLQKVQCTCWHLTSYNNKCCGR